MGLSRRRAESCGLVAVAVVAAGLGAGAPRLAAQDQALMARVYGTRLPAEYWSLLRAEPRLFGFERALRAVAERARRAGEAGPAGLGVRPPVAGTYRVPVVYGLFADGLAPAVRAADLQRELFDGPNTYYRTVREFYAELSNGRFTLTGTVFDTVRSTLALRQAMGTDGCLATLDCRLGDFIHEVLRAVDARGVDWGPYDNDGPDGVPNSGDDDGYVDVLAVFHPVLGGECGGPGPWARRTSLAALPAPRAPFVTRTPSARAGFGNIRVNDLILQSALSCEPGRTVTEIGIFAHEFGHALGLPDLYDTDPNDGSDSQGVGAWDLMGTGSWGCTGARQPERPCHLGAWSKEQLGWVVVEAVPGGQRSAPRTLDAVETSYRVLRVESGDGAREYYLLESRQPVGFDLGIWAPGLLVWHIDRDAVEAGWPFNRVNTDPRRYGVAIVEADGDADLKKNTSAGGNQGDAFDPFPGAGQNRAFHAGSRPASLTNAGWATGLTLQNIALSGTQSRFDLATRFDTLRIHVQGADSARVTIDGRRAVRVPAAIPWAPFERRTLAAEPGLAAGAPGVRLGFAGWSDQPARERPFTTAFVDSTLTVRYARQYQLAVRLEGPVPGVAPGTVRFSPPAADDGWFAPGTAVDVLAEPLTGFAFERWEGAAAGGANPVRVLMDTARALRGFFRQTFAARPAGPVTIAGADSVEIVLQAENGTPPFLWTLQAGRLPAGLELRPAGRIAGAALELGDFPLALAVRDAVGLTATLELPLRVRAPGIPVSALVAPFLGTPGGPTVAQRQLLDRLGNGNGSYDVGDLRAFLLANPGLPATAAEAALVRILVPPARLEARTP